MRMQSIGAITIDRIVEQDRFVFEPQWLFRDSGPELILRHRAALGPRFIDFDSNGLILSFHSYLIRTRHRNILVDTCNGNHKHRPGVPWQHMLAGEHYLRNLGLRGLRREDVDTVLCTHLHGDHVGWNTHLVDGRWLPTFPNAKYVMALQDYRHFSHLPAGPTGRPTIHPSLADSIAPVVEAGQAEFVDISSLGRHYLDDGVWIEAATGHTPGHIVVHVGAQDAHAVLCGDVIHHPIQFLEPQLVNPGDVDPAMARHTRQRLIDAVCAEHALLLTGHFPAPTAGYLLADGERVRFAFADE
jgi:glyoxylase-like metal-dependent hydrolase (beta-lactamase superfamily II)